MSSDQQVCQKFHLLRTFVKGKAFNMFADLQKQIVLSNCSCEILVQTCKEFCLEVSSDKTEYMNTAWNQNQL